MEPEAGPIRRRAYSRNADGDHVLLGAQIFYSVNIVLQNAPYSIDDISILSILEFDNDCLSVPAGSPYTVAEEENTMV